MKASNLLFLVLLLTTSLFSVSLDDIEYWVGEGSNRAGLVIDWQDGITPQSIMWGYRWDGTATGEDMLNAIVASDTRLSGDVSLPTTINYDLNNDGSLDADDHQRTANMSAGSYWPYFIGTDGENWSYATTTHAGRTLSNGDWDGWSYCSDWTGDTFPPSLPTAAEVPTVSFSFDDIAYWIGEGDNVAMLVIDFNDSTNDETESFAWGYRWSGDNDINGITLLNTIQTIDTRLTIDISSGLLNDIIFDYDTVHEGLSGDPDWWSTWTKQLDGEWAMNSGVTTSISSGDRFGCSYGFTPATTEPDFPVAVSAIVAEELITQDDIINIKNTITSIVKPLFNDNYNCDFTLSLLDTPSDCSIDIIDNELHVTPNESFEGSIEIDYKLVSLNNLESNISTITINVFSPFAPQVETEGTTAIFVEDTSILEWATGVIIDRGYVDVTDQSQGFATYGDDSDALGMAEGNSYDVVSLGDGGVATLTFEHNIYDGEGYDFAVFENGFGDNSLELAFVEVSSNGSDYIRFPAVSLTQAYTQVTGFDSLYAEDIHNFAGKYRQGYGTPFDLSELPESDLVDTNNISHVRIIDVIGSIDTEYATYDVYGYPVNDPFPTDFSSSGFDLDAVGVINHIGTEANSDNNPELFTTELIGNYPNPFNPTTSINYLLKNESDVSLKIFNVKGQLVRELVNGVQKQGNHTIVWNGYNSNNKQVAGGVYFYKLDTKEYTSTKKMLLLK